MKNSGCWFVSLTAGLTVEKLRSAMGDFDNITPASTCVARRGQCLSTTRLGFTAQDYGWSWRRVYLKDVVIEGTLRSDGCSIIS